MARARWQRRRWSLRSPIPHRRHRAPKWDWEGRRPNATRGEPRRRSFLLRLTAQVFGCTRTRCASSRPWLSSSGVPLPDSRPARSASCVPFTQPTRGRKTDADYSSTLKIGTHFFSRNVFLSRSDLVIPDARRFSSIVGDVDLEIGEESRRFRSQQSQQHDRAATDLQLGAFTRP